MDPAPSPPPPSPPHPAVVAIHPAVVAIRRQLREVRGDASHLLDDGILSRLGLADEPLAGGAAARADAEEVALHGGHPAIRLVLPRLEGDPVALAFAASAVYSAINRFYESISDGHEQEFQSRFVDYLLGEVLGEG